MRLIARAMDEMNREAVIEAVRRTPGENIEIGLRLGDLALAMAQHQVPRPDEVAPSALWQARRHSKRTGK